MVAMFEHYEEDERREAEEAEARVEAGMGVLELGMDWAAAGSLGCKYGLNVVLVQTIYLVAFRNTITKK